MKSFKKIAAFMFAVLIAMSFGACSRQGATANKEWSFKAYGKEYPMGVYLAAMSDAYEEAYATLYYQNSSFDTGDTILQMETSFDESGKIYTVKEWMSKISHEYLQRFAALDYLVDKHGVTLSDYAQSSAYEQARNNWYVGDLEGELDGISTAYPLKDKYEPIGISFDSYYQVSYLMNVKFQAVFDKLYSKGGEREVPDKDLTEYFEKNYTSYSYFVADLYEQTADEVTGEIVTAPFDEKTTQEVKAKIESYEEMIKNGATTQEISDDYKAYTNSVGNSSMFMSNVEHYDDVEVSLSVEIAEALRNMDNNTATTIYLGQENTPIAVFVYKSDVSKLTKDYIGDEINYKTILENYKGDEFESYVDELADKTVLEYNPIIEEKFTAEYIEEKYRKYLSEFEQ